MTTPSTRRAPAPRPRAPVAGQLLRGGRRAARRQVARVAEEVNSSVDNIGARRLHTVLERILEEISFEAPERARWPAALTRLRRANARPTRGRTRRADGGREARQVREAAESGSEGRVRMAVTKELVAERVGELLKRQDLSKYVL